MQNIQRLLEIMAALRHPDSGCPWDVEQDFASIAPYTIEEAYEVADAIARGDMEGLKEELGDLLLQSVFHAQMAKEAGLFDFETVAGGIADKLVARHPHVFGERSDIRSASDQEHAWEEMKREERLKKDAKAESLMDGVTLGLPGLLRAVKLQKRAAKAGFDWVDARDIFAKLDEETAELQEALDEGFSKAALREELGDLLFVCANLARRLEIDPEEALREANAKFERRFRAMEAMAEAEKQPLKGRDLDALEALWVAAKQQEKKAA